MSVTLIPPELTHGPFTLEHARRFGLAPNDLRRSAYRRLLRGVYMDAKLTLTTEHLLKGASFHLPPRSGFSGRAAAYLDGLDVDCLNPIEVDVDPSQSVSARHGVRLYRTPLAEADIVTRRGFRATRMPRTINALARRLSLVEAVVITDQALHAGVVTQDELEALVAVRAGRYGVKALRRVVEQAEPKSESPMETRLRLLLIRAGLPRPVAQYEIRAENGLFLARVDLAYPDRKIALEYDGGGHRTQMTEDNRRQNLIVQARWRLLRFTAPDVQSRQDATAATVTAALKESIAL